MNSHPYAVLLLLIRAIEGPDSRMTGFLMVHHPYMPVEIEQGLRSKVDVAFATRYSKYCILYSLQFLDLI